MVRIRRFDTILGLPSPVEYSLREYTQFRREEQLTQIPYGISHSQLGLGQGVMSQIEINAAASKNVTLEGGNGAVQRPVVGFL